MSDISAGRSLGDEATDRLQSPRLVGAYSAAGESLPPQAANDRHRNKRRDLNTVRNLVVRDRRQEEEFPLYRSV